MKPIEQLGISQWPWDYQPNHPDGCRVATAYNCDVSTAEPSNARLMSASPELYKALYDVRLFVEWCANDPDNKVLAERARKHYNEICAALEKASGEKEVR